MPIIEMKAFPKRFEDADQRDRMIAKLTDAVEEVFGEKLASETEVILHGVPSTHWGFGGKIREV